MNNTTNKTLTHALSLQDPLTEFLLYTAPNGEVKVEVLLNNETLWLTQKRIAVLFGVGVPAISKHLSNIFDSGELQEEVVISILENTTKHGAIEGKTQTSRVKYTSFPRSCVGTSNGMKHSKQGS